MCDLRYCSSPAAGLPRSKLQSKTMGGALLACSARSSSTEIRVVYMPEIIGLSVFFRRCVRRGARAQNRRADTARDDERHAGPARERDAVAEQRDAVDRAEDDAEI